MSRIVSNNVIKEYNATRSFFKKKKLCYAPFNSLRFSLSGNIYSCCYNRFQSLGKYPEVSIHEAWNGTKADELRKKIKENDLSLGCHACYSKLISSNYYSAGSKIYDGYKVKKNGPSLMEFELSNVCNLECVMCNGENSSLIRKNKEHADPYPMVYDENFVQQLKEFIPFLNEARFVGGEPFLTDIYYKIWDLIAKENRKVKISILTNGTILNDKIIEFFKKNNVHISFSIDSIIKDTYQQIRINADYEKVMMNIEAVQKLSKEYNREMSVNICPIRKNMYEIPEITEYFSKKNVPVIFHTVVYPPSESLSTLTKKELKEYASFLENAGFLKSHSLNDKNYFSYKSLISLVKAWENEKPINFDNEISFEKQWTLLAEHIAESPLAKNIQIQKNIEELKAVFDEILDEKIRAKALVALLKIDAGYIIAEIENSSREKLKNRILVMGS